MSRRSPLGKRESVGFIAGPRSSVKATDARTPIVMDVLLVLLLLLLLLFLILILIVLVLLHAARRRSQRAEQDYDEDY